MGNRVLAQSLNPLFIRSQFQRMDIGLHYPKQAKSLNPLFIRSQFQRSAVAVSLFALFVLSQSLIHQVSVSENTIVRAIEVAQKGLNPLFIRSQFQRGIETGIACNQIFESQSLIHQVSVSERN